MKQGFVQAGVGTKGGGASLVGFLAHKKCCGKVRCLDLIRFTIMVSSFGAQEVLWEGALSRFNSI